MTGKRPNCIQNRLLAALPPAELARLKPGLQPVDLVPGQTLSEKGMSMDQVYFPEAGMIGLLRPEHGAAMAEVGVVGREGFVGVGVVLGGDLNFLGKMVEIAGSALRIPMAVLRTQLDRCPALTKELLRFLRALLFQISQSTVCTGHHDVEERLAHWLLMARDRVDGDVVPLRQEFLSMMLGVGQPGATAALNAFKKARLIRQDRGKIEILDRRGLEAAACHCYGAIREEYRRLLP